MPHALSAQAAPAIKKASAGQPPRGRRALLGATLAIAGLALSACAAFQPQTPVEAVTQRAQQRWDDMRANKFEASYELTAPSFRAVKTFKAYRDQYGQGDFWVAAKVVQVTCATEKACTAVVEISVRNMTPIQQPPILTTALRENWVKEDGAWYVLPNL